jgi:UDPglucose 6-dehydrogenase
MEAGKVVVNKSPPYLSAPPAGYGDTSRPRRPWSRSSARRGLQPEFLKEGAAVADCLRPDRIIIGTDSDHLFSLLEELYALQPQARPHPADGCAAPS